jgi:hypothetical protein
LSVVGRAGGPNEKESAMGTVALEFVPPSVQGGKEKAVEEATKARDRMRNAGIADKVDHLLIPGIIEEEGDRPVPFEEKMDPLDTRKAVDEVLPLRTLVTQVTAFATQAELEQRVTALREGGVEGVVFVGVPRTMQDGEGPGLSPVEALGHFSNQMPRRGCILIPTRPDEKGRFQFKLDSGANFALTQLLFSEQICEFLPTMQDTEHKPEILLSFGYVPEAEQRVGLIQWLIKDESPVVQKEMQWVAELAQQPFAERKKNLVDHYKRVIDGLRDLGFPLGIHLEAPYGYSEKAMETFSEMLEYFSP